MTTNDDIKYHAFRFLTSEGREGVIFDTDEAGTNALHFLQEHEGYDIALFKRTGEATHGTNT